MLLRSTYADLESEREVVLEEIAMYEDEPQDKVHDVLSTAVFGDHPLGRPVIGRGEVISALTVGRRSPPTTTPATCRARSWSRRPATSSTRRSSELARAVARQRPRNGAGPRRRRRPRRREPRGRLPREGDRAVPHLPRRARASRRNDERRFALVDPRRDPGRLDLLAPVPGGAREARPRLRGLLVGEPVPRTPARSASTSARARTTSSRRST